MSLRFHSHVAVAAYHDLRRLLLDDQVSELRGSPTHVKVKGNGFWYDKYRIGDTMAQRYIGPDTEELRSRLERFVALREERESRRRARTRLVRILRAEGYASTDAKTGGILGAFSKVGVFRLGGTLVGTIAFRHYEGELGVALDFDQLARTDDLDIASFERLSVAVGDQVEPPLADVFSDFSFHPIPSIERGQVWRWEQQGEDGMMVEFLMPAHGDEGIRPLRALGVSARALRHLDYLIEDPIPAVSLYRSGVLVRIPRPERYAIHKLIVADRRQMGADGDKARKDRAQAAFLIEALAETRPDELLDAYDVAMARGPKWRDRIAASLKRLPASAERLESLLAERR